MQSINEKILFIESVGQKKLSSTYNIDMCEWLIDE